jgi:hypothetical protein
MKIIRSQSLEKKEFFEKRTNRHISLVQKYCGNIYEYDPKRFDGLIEQARNHDDSKYKEPEYSPYVNITWE